MMASGRGGEGAATAHKGVHTGYHIHYVFSIHPLKLRTSRFGIQWSWGTADMLTWAYGGT